MENKIYISPSIVDTVLVDYIARLKTGEQVRPQNLTAREREVLQLIAEGLKTKEIAARLNISMKTIENHRQQIMDKLNLRSIAALTKYAIREGLTSLDL